MRRYFSSFLLALFCICGSSMLFAQSTTGTILGQVTDPTGAALPKAHVTVTNTLLPLLRRAGGARIVNVSSMLGSLSMAADPQGPFSAWPGAFLLAYNSSKTALNALTVMWASALREEGIKVNSADPGYVATDLNHHSGNSTVEQGAEIIVALATLAGDGPTGTFQAAGSARPW